MAKRLTEEMVVARSKLSDLSKVKRLNCWGSELVDVSLLRKMPSVEVLSLSINKINSLIDFQLCGALQELYIRQNDIRDLNQICYLQGLSQLKNLWLDENPCAGGDMYRLTVLRTLPQLQKLDNIPVTQEELREAGRKGKTLTHPEDPQDSEEEYASPNQYQRFQDYPNEEYSPQRSPPPRQEPEYEQEEADEYYGKDETMTMNNHAEYSPVQQSSPPRRETTRMNYFPEPEYADRRSNNYEQEYSRNSQQYYDKSPINNNSTDEGGDGASRDIKLVTSQSANSIKDYTNGDRYHSQNNCRASEGSDISANTHEGSTRRERYTCPAAHQPPFNRRPVTRNSNILSAVLCLVKELDYPSLEVVEMAVRCRMDELEE